MTPYLLKNKNLKNKLRNGARWPQIIITERTAVHRQLK